MSPWNRAATSFITVNPYIYTKKGVVYVYGVIFILHFDFHTYILISQQELLMNDYHLNFQNNLPAYMNVALFTYVHGCLH